jgi:hypothetical protein
MRSEAVDHDYVQAIEVKQQGRLDLFGGFGELSVVIAAAGIVLVVDPRKPLFEAPPVRVVEQQTLDDRRVEPEHARLCCLVLQ